MKAQMTKIGIVGLTQLVLTLSAYADISVGDTATYVFSTGREETHVVTVINPVENSYSVSVGDLTESKKLSSHTARDEALENCDVISVFPDKGRRESVTVAAGTFEDACRYSTKVAGVIVDAFYSNAVPFHLIKVSFLNRGDEVTKELKSFSSNSPKSENEK